MRLKLKKIQIIRKVRNIKCFQKWTFLILFKGSKVLIFFVEFPELSHLTRDFSQAEKKINVVTSYFTQNGQSCHFGRI